MPKDTQNQSKYMFETIVAYEFYLCLNCEILKKRKATSIGFVCVLVFAVTTFSVVFL